MPHDPDPVIHDPRRLRILMLLSGLATADFNFLRATLGMTNGNLSSHMGRLEQARYVEIAKTFQGKVPHTSYRLTRTGRQAVERYWMLMDRIREGAVKAR
jgi:DNA-binding HxlR family transcriptional regulator